MDITERLRELDKKGYQPLTGAIGEEAATEIEKLRELVSAQKREHTTTADNGYPCDDGYPADDDEPMTVGLDCCPHMVPYGSDCDKCDEDDADTPMGLAPNADDSLSIGQVFAMALNAEERR